MTTLKGWITTTCLAAMLMVSAMSANAGVIIGGATAPAPCTDPTVRVKIEGIGVIIGGLTGVIIGGLTGVIIGGVTDEPVNCGVIIGG